MGVPVPVTVLRQSVGQGDGQCTVVGQPLQIGKALQGDWRLLRDDPAQHDPLAVVAALAGKPAGLRGQRQVPLAAQCRCQCLE